MKRWLMINKFWLFKAKNNGFFPFYLKRVHCPRPPRPICFREVDGSFFRCLKGRHDEDRSYRSE